MINKRMKLLNLFWRKPKTVEAKKQSIDLTKLEGHFILNVGVAHCDICTKETENCCKIDLADQCVCICPRKDIKGFRKPKND